MNEQIIKPSDIKTPDFVTGKKGNSESYIFDCTTCDEKLELNYMTQIENSWTGKGLALNEQEYIALKRHYNIGIVNKSREGGFPVFDKIYCNKCKTGYYTYVGIDEPLNSCYHIQVQGIMKSE